MRPPSEKVVNGWRQRFEGYNVGILTGPQSDMTVVDVDDSADLPKVIQRFGDTPLKEKTPRGAHLFYRHDGERSRSLRKVGLNADIKGAGGFIIVNPSVRADGGKYRPLQGDWDDIGDLPRMKPDAPSERPAVGLPMPGERNDYLWREAMKEARYCDTEADLADVMHTINDSLIVPQDAHLIDGYIRYAWDQTERGLNRFGREPHLIVYKSQVTNWPTDDLRAGDAYLLLHRLRVEHGWRNGDEFILANAFASAFGWTLHRFRGARDFLVSLGLLECLHLGGRGKHDPPIYRLAPKVSESAHNNKIYPPQRGKRH